MNFKKRLNTVIFESDTLAGKAFDIILIASILLSVIVVMLDSVDPINARHGKSLYLAEWFFTLLFSIEYVTRLYCSSRPARYATSFFGVVDLISVLPTYISLLVSGTQFLLVIRVLRVLRIFRVLKILTYIAEAKLLAEALKESRRKVIIFLFTVLTLVVVLGSLMYLIEASSESEFTSIPSSIYWAIVTLTTVGYGDITPSTIAGRILASVIMITGYSIIAIPTGIFTFAIQRQGRGNRICPSCNTRGHDLDASYCKFCGTPLSKLQTS